MPVILPLTPSDPNYTFTCTIRGEDVAIAARWNARDKVILNGVEIVKGAWFLDWFDADGKPIAIGMKVVLGVNLGRQLTHELFKHIVVRAVDTTRQGLDAGLDDIGTRVVVRVYTVSDTGFIE